MIVRHWLAEAASSNFTCAIDSPTEASGETTHDGVKIVWGSKIPMHDGIRLNGTVYKPGHLKHALPAIFTLTPYTADSYHERAFYFAKNGYVFVLVDCRGRGNSEGEFEPFAGDGLDGYDVVEWLARQPWCNGKVGMWGGSYAGFNQWATLKHSPSHLATIVPAAAACPGVDMPTFNGIHFLYEMQWLTLTSGVTANQKIFGDSAFWIQRFRELYLKHRPFKDLDKIVGNPSRHFKSWLNVPPGNLYWKKVVPTAEEYGEIKIPILTITGQYDADQGGAMHYYSAHMKYGSKRACANHYLIMGPWDHAGTRTPSKEFGGLTLSEASVVDLNKLHKEWYDWTLKKGKKPEFLKKRVAYYVTGAEEWKYSKDLAQTHTLNRRLYLNSVDGHANDVFDSGTMNEIKPTNGTPDSYTYDPLDVRPAEIEREDVKSHLVDMRYVMNLFGSGLVYHAAPLAKEMEISGYVKFVAWIALDVPDTDFWIALYEIAANGSSLILAVDLMRARYRLSLDRETLVDRNQIHRYEFDTFNFVSRRLPKGSRLRLVLRSPNSIYYQKNYNSGGVVHEECAQDARIAHVRLYHDAQHQSFLEVPISK